MREYVEQATINGLTVRNAKPDGYPSKTETGTVPASFVVELDESIAANSALTITIDSVPVIIKPWDFAPAAGEVSIDRRRGLVRCNSSAEGLALSVTYVPAGTILSAGKLEAILDA